MDPASMIAAAVPPRAPATPKPEPSYDEKNAVEFPVPANFNPPADMKPGDSFQALGTFKIKPDGGMCLVAVDGEPVKKTPEKIEEVKEKETSALPAIKKDLPATGLPAY